MRARLRLALSLRVLPARVALFYWRAQRRARRDDDRFSLASAARPAELAELLSLARDRRAVVELGTGTAWSALALALDDPVRRVISYDPCVRAEREAYLALAGRGARERVELREEPDSNGPHAGDAPVEVLFIDSQHEREPVVSAFRAWRDALAPNAVVVFHDYGHPDYPGVAQGIADLELRGVESGGLFVWRAAAGDPVEVAR
ncbi:MAG TPA: class I SAM-dependent methyltransferase [Solirubrobacteraceae bacterium]|nr:class I SAM-dependent methyltransferase [Solirubrobacteraceae bacterium]